MKAVQLSLEEVKAESTRSATKHEGTINALAIDNDRLYSVGSKGNLMLWFQESLRQQDTIPVVDSGLESITVDDDYLYVGSIADDNNKLSLYIDDGSDLTVDGVSTDNQKEKKLDPMWYNLPMYGKTPRNWGRSSGVKRPENDLRVTFRA